MRKISSQGSNLDLPIASQMLLPQNSWTLEQRIIAILIDHKLIFSTRAQSLHYIHVKGPVSDVPAYLMCELVCQTHAVQNSVFQ